MGSTTFRKTANQVGVKPDESYCLGTEKEFPDLVIEVIVPSGGSDRLQRFGYELIHQSELLPDLDLNLLSRCVQNPNPLAAVKAFRQKIQKQQNQK